MRRWKDEIIKSRHCSAVITSRGIRSITNNGFYWNVMRSFYIVNYRQVHVLVKSRYNTSKLGRCIYFLLVTILRFLKDLLLFRFIAYTSWFYFTIRKTPPFGEVFSFLKLNCFFILNYVLKFKYNFKNFQCR